MAITKVQSVQGQGTKSDQCYVTTKDIGLLPMGKKQQKQSAKVTTKRG
jgi:hypothetical protein